MIMNFWTTPEVLNLLKQLLATGKSASLIAVEMAKELQHPISRNAVIGAIHRYCQDEVKPKFVVRKKQQPRPKSPPPLPPTPPKTPPMKITTQTELLKLSRSMCHWPIGDPREKDFCFCGKPTAKYPYCTHHRNIAHHRKSPPGLATGGQVVD